jgi:hypothetical protein
LQEREELAHRARVSGDVQKAEVESSERAVQIVLAHILDTPHQQVMPFITERFPGRDLSDFYAPVLRSTKATIEAFIGELQKGTGTDPSPTQLDRLCFCWRILRGADLALRTTKKPEIITHARDAAEAFHNLLTIPLQEPLLSALISKLRLGEDARYLYHYFAFRRSKALLPPPFDRAAKNGNLELLRTVIWWSIRARKEQYVEVRPKEPIRIEFGFVVDQVLEDLKRRCGPEVENVSGIDSAVEGELNAWLAYSRLDLSSDDAVAETGSDAEIAKAFIKHNDLTTKLRVHRSGGGGADDDRTKQLQSQNVHLMEEVRVLEQRLRGLELSTTVTPTIDLDSTALQFAEIREMLKIVDTKYGFDTLNSIQMGDNTHLTLRSFLSHLFYALRKRGFSEYPKEDCFELSYEASGLYDCDGFEVPPAGCVRVRVTKKGWGFESRGQWFPVRRARVITAPQQ